MKQKIKVGSIVVNKIKNNVNPTLNENKQNVLSHKDNFLSSNTIDLLFDSTLEERDEKFLNWINNLY
jgi:hypothetical protein